MPSELATLLERPSIEVAPLLLGAVLHGRGVSLRITEVEAYLGEQDPGSHAFRGVTPRTTVMYGPPGHLYVYFTYGMHVCANVVCSPDGEASAVLLRAGEIVDGIETARERRTTSKVDADLARGPARLCVALGITLGDTGADLLSTADDAPITLELPQHPSTRGEFAPLNASRATAEGRKLAPRGSAAYETGPRTGVSGAGGTHAYPWRFWIPGDPTVSPYKPHVPKKRVAG